MKIHFFIKKQLIQLFIVLCLFSCSNKQENPQQNKAAATHNTTTTHQAPKVVVINQLSDSLQPKVTFLSQVAPTIIKQAGQPKITELPTSISLIDSSVIIHPEAQGKGLFTTYTSDDGLAMDAISWGNKSSICDRHGNIWFGTSGGGVSKYDGKSFSTYTVAQGLANSSVFSIAEDKSGNLWFGTSGGGVSKYDGKSFTSYSVEQGLANNTVFSIAEDKSGNLWFGTGGGVSKYDGKSFSTYSVEQGLANNSVFSIAEDKSGNLWFGTGGGVSKYDPLAELRAGSKSFSTYTVAQGLANNYVFSIAEDKSGNLWFGTYGGVSKYDGKSFSTYTVEQGLANNYVRSITEDKSGNLWFGTSGGGVSKYDGKSFSTYTVEQGLANNSVFSIAEDKSGNLWFGTSGGGVSKYDGKSFSTYSVEQGLANNTVFSIAEDKRGNLWFGTSGGGVSKYDGKSFSTYIVEQGLANNNVRSITEDKSGNLWFGTGGGVSKYDPSAELRAGSKSFTSYTVEQGLANNNVFSIVEDKSGNLWFGTYGGVSKYDGKSFTSYTVAQGLANNTVLSIAEDKSGNLWFGTYGGVSKYDGKSFSTYTVAQGLANNTVLSIAEDKSGNLWFGTDLGLMVVPYGLGDVSNGTNEIKFKKVTNQLTNLPDKVIGAIQIDNKGRMILGTNYGLYVLSAKEVKTILASAKTVEGTVYNQFTGYPIKDVNFGSNNNGATCIDNKGILWVGHGSNGVTRVDLDAVNKSSEAPNVVINKVSLKGDGVCFYSLGASLRGTKQSAPNDEIALSATLPRNDDSTILAQQEIATYGKALTQAERDTLQQRFAGVEFDGITKFYPLPENLELPYNHNALTFEFNAIETDRNFMVNYQYALAEGTSLRGTKQSAPNDEIALSATLPRNDGKKVDWSPITKKHDATFNNLWEGEYTFLLKAQSPFGVWSEPITFTFTVLPPWYRTWWAYLSYVLLFVIGILVLIRLQTRRLKQRQKELEYEVEIATHEIREQKEHIEEVHKEITDSINYAERIQRSFLATKEILDKNLGVISSTDSGGVSRNDPNYFVFFRPKDVVSGDFYWAGKLNNGNFALVNADSTGHGVPGAIMSILNISSIEKAIETETAPHLILNTTRKLIIERLKKDGSAAGGKDGMDASLLIFNADKTQLIFAAANNPVWIVRKRHSALDAESPNSKIANHTHKGKYELLEHKADRMPVGRGEQDTKSFTLKTTILKKGDVIYTLTDGFQDQFGGSKGKKFMVKKLKNLLLSIAHLPMEEQEQQLENIFSNWKGEEEQVDDVCIIGVRI